MFSIIVATWVAFSMLAQPVPPGAAHTSPIIYTSDNDGWTWQSADTGLPPDAQVEYVETLGDFVFLGTENHGLFRKNLRSGAWQPIGMPHFVENEKITGLYANGTELFACIYRAGFYKSADSGISWVPMHESLEDKAVRAVLQQGKNLFIGADTGVFLSSDEGKTWQQVFSKGQVTSLVESNGMLFGGSFKGMIRSKDGGVHWEWVLEDGAVHKTAVFGNQVVAVNMSGQIRTTTDGGQSWQHSSMGLPQGADVFEIIHTGPFYLCSHSQGIYRTSSLNGFWELVLETPHEKILDLAVANGIAYGGTVRRN